MTPDQHIVQAVRSAISLIRREWRSALFIAVVMGIAVLMGIVTGGIE